jgi:hypothetical protein
MTTTNLALDDSLTNLTEGQNQKEASINGNTQKQILNLQKLDVSIPIFMGDFPSEPSSGTAALGSTYFNTGDNRLYFLRSKSPDIYYGL